MPELPEVETIRRGLGNTMIGAVIESVDVRSPKQVRGEVASLIDKKITEIRRHGKLLVFILDDTSAFAVHLKMTGQLLWRGNGNESVMGGHPSQGYMDPLPHKHTRIVMHLSGGATLFFNDMRMFGYLSVLTEEGLAENTFVSSLGPEPLSDDFTLDYLISKMRRKPKSVLKAFLLDQTNIAGLGNIYADESCFRAGILPTHLSGSLNQAQQEALFHSIVETLELAITHGGSSERDYLNAIGEKGTYLKVANVYHRTGLPCNRCKEGTIERVKVGGRSTHYCPVCQK